MTPPSLTYAFGRVDITPDRPMPLFGRLGRTMPWDGIVSRLEANVAVFGKGDEQQALIAIDSLYPSQSLIDAVATLLAEKGTPIAKDALLFVASHTHNAPALDPTKPLLGEFDPDYLAEVAERIANSLHTLCLTDGQHTTMSASAARCDASMFRRRMVNGLRLPSMRLVRRMVMAPQPQEVIDDSLTLLLWTKTDGTPLAALWQWACHAVSEPKTQAISADFPAVVRDHLRAKWNAPDLPILYFPGFSGDIRPDSTSPLPLHRSGRWWGIAPRFAANSAATAAALHAKLLAATGAAVDGLEGIDAASVNLARERTTIAMDHLRDVASEMPPVTVDHWQIGALRVIATSAEVSHRYRGDPQQGQLSLATGCAQQVFGYLPTDAQIAEGGYEGGDFAKAFSVPGEFRPAIDHLFVAAHQLGPVR